MKINLTLNFLKNLLNFWKNVSYILIILLLTPIVMLILSSFQNNIDTWLHLFDTKLFIYFYNTLSLIIGVGILSITIGVSCAWIVAKYKFFLSHFIEWGLLLPAAIPAYIVAYCYTDFLEYGGKCLKAYPKYKKIEREISSDDENNSKYFVKDKSIPAIFISGPIL